MHRHDGARARRQRRFDLSYLDIAVAQSHIDEHRHCADAHHDVRGGREAHGRNDHFVARTNPGGDERHLECACG